MKFKFVRVSPFSGRSHEMEIEMTQEQFDELSSPNRRAIQDIIPHCSADEREFIMTGITPAEWDDTFGGGDEPKDPPKERTVEDVLDCLSSIFTVKAVIDHKDLN